MFRGVKMVFLWSKKDFYKTLNCPKCDVPMQKKTKMDVTIDKCNKCGGIWLDRGEMEKIIKKMTEESKKAKGK